MTAVRAARRTHPVRASGSYRSGESLAAGPTFRRPWTRARAAIGLPDLHFHDLRHTGNTMAAGQGASLLRGMVIDF